MKLSELRRRAAQRQAARGTQDVKQMVDIFGNEQTHEVYLKFTFLTDHLKMTADQAIDHGTKVLGAAVACGAKLDIAKLNASIEGAKQAIAMDQKKAAGNPGGH